MTRGTQIEKGIIKWQKMAKKGKSGEERAMNKPRKETYGV